MVESDRFDTELHIVSVTVTDELGELENLMFSYELSNGKRKRVYYLGLQSTTIRALSGTYCLV